MAFTIDVHHHILPDVFWRATNDAHDPVGGISPAPWSKESTLSYMDDARIVIAGAELQANEARAVLVGNALKLFPRFAGHAATQTTNAA